MSDYPEHDKLQAISEESQAIGEFLDFGVPRMGLAIYERFAVECECSTCRAGQGHDDPWHSEDEQIIAAFNGGVVLSERWMPTTRRIESMLAEWFGIDQDRIDAEKEAMLAALRDGAL